MTCHDALTLLEEYIDKDLPAEKEALVKQHFDSCPGCREELDAMLLLKELFKSNKVPDPGEAYWAETTRIIKARTIEAPGEELIATNITDIRTMQKNALMRSVVSVAASLVILFSALLIGSGQQERLARIESSQPPVLYSAALDEVVGEDNTVYVTRDETKRVAQGMLLMGAPGLLGRFSSTISVVAVSN
jgi:hypothetical protein